MQHYCTLFNSAYLSRGLALYQSLLNTGTDFHLFVFAFDDATEQILTALRLSHMTVIPLSDLETPALRAVKPHRTLGEYCWTCTSASILYCLERFDIPSVCYCDADIYFWRDPTILLEEVKTGSILLTEHRYTPQYDRTLEAGRYCVQFMWFKRDARGLKALTWWRDACLAWCYDRVEPGRFGDQKYCDDWTERFEGVVVLQHLGGGVAPWNVQQYQPVKHHQTRPVLVCQKTGVQFDLVFYHFHALRFVNDYVDLGTYQLSKAIINLIYKPYVKMLLSAEKRLASASEVTNAVKSVNLHGRIIRPGTWVGRLKRLKQQLLGQYHGLNASGE